MKNIGFKIFSLIVFAALLVSCRYDPFTSDYDYSAVYFPKERIDRSVIVNEYDYIQVGAVLAGKIENNDEEWVGYTFNDDTVQSFGLTLLPEAYYTLENSIEGKESNKLFMVPGEFLGMVKITLNEQFFKDSLALSGGYGLFFELDDQNMSVDSILEDHYTTLITFKYISSEAGTYYHKGLAISSTDTLFYNDKTWDLKTIGVGETLLLTTGLAGAIGGSNYCTLRINADNSVSMEDASGVDVLTDSGEGKYDPETRTFYLKYSFEDAGTVYSSVDTLSFRNRIVDLINQWDI